jgi:hypothetical protein
LGLAGWHITQAGLSPFAAVCWSGGVLQNIKLQTANLSVLGAGYHSDTRFQVSGVGKKKHKS